MTDDIVIRGAAEHNLKHIDVNIPRNSLCVVTGLSGSGKSSLAYDVVFREGQRRFVESLSSYARQYLGKLDKPKFEHIEGLSPTISIDQKTISRNPRSTVGTITELLDHLRLLFARLGTPHCPQCGGEIESQTVDQIVQWAYRTCEGQDVVITAPIVVDRKGEYRKELTELREQGFVRVRVDGEIRRLDEDIVLARYENHSIEVVYDRIKLTPDRLSRFSESVEKALELAEGLVKLIVGDRSYLRSSRFSCPSCDLSLPEVEPRLFSFNSPHGSCSRCEGLGRARTVALDRLIPDPTLTVNDGLFATQTRAGALQYTGLSIADLDDAADDDFSLDIPWEDLPDASREWVLFGGSPHRRVARPAVAKKKWRGRRRKKAPPRSFPGIVTLMEEKYRTGGSARLEKLLDYGDCPECRGSRLNGAARSVRFRDHGIDQLSDLSVASARDFFGSLELTTDEEPVGRPIVREILHRLEFMDRVGLGYLSLHRSADTLSGGEAQRIRLASQLGSGLRGVLYVLDEPSIGLHARDNWAMLETLRKLRDLGNSVLVVEHDEETIRAADYVIDIGPGAGVHGGELIEAGSVTAVKENPASRTGRYLSGAEAIEIPPERRKPGGKEKWIEVLGARHHNLKNVNVRFPLGLFVAVTGVSGSGKSSLVHDILYRAVATELGYELPAPGAHREIRGLEQVDKVIEIDQSPIGRTPRSNPGTYTKVFDEIRELFARLPESKVRGYAKGRFSFNVKGGRCENCQGGGVIVYKMQFLADVEITCEECEGRRYNRETLEITYRGQTVSEILDMPIEAAAEFFTDLPKIQRTLQTLVDVGLGYVRLGQPSTTLSGGEAQRVKLAHELRKAATGRTLYLLDEPTTGLHFDDIRRLLKTLDRLVSHGNTVVVIEHNLDVVKFADYLIDLGPDGGEGGGELVAVGTPEKVAKGKGATAEALALALRGEMLIPAADLRKGRRKGGKKRDPQDKFVIVGARENNLKNIDLEIPRGKMTVITGPSGSGKSTLAFDILFAEGQRRYVESLSTYARRFLGRMQSVDVDRVEGIAPAIAIDQQNRTTSPRSTVATSTEIYDYLRLLFARIGQPHCPDCDAPLQATTPSAAARRVVEIFGDQPSFITTPLLKPGQSEQISSGEELRRMSADLLREGFVRILVGAEAHRLEDLPEDWTPPPGDAIALVLDRLVPSKVTLSRLAESIEVAYRRGGELRVVSRDGKRALSCTELPSCPNGHFSWQEELTPRLFSFNHHSGACPVCHGLGERRELSPDLLFTDPRLPLFGGAMDHRLGKWFSRPKGRIRKVLTKLFDEEGWDLARPVSKLTAKMRRFLFDGTGDRIYKVRFRSMVRGMQTSSPWEGLNELVVRWHGRANSPRWRSALEERMMKQACSGCGGGRLRPELLQVRVGGYNIQRLTTLSVKEAAVCFDSLKLDRRSRAIAEEVLSEIEGRLRFLLDVGLDYLTLDRGTETLSGGEAQRIRLATQIGNHLVGVLYVLDEPTIGLHQRDNERLLKSLIRLRDLGNSVVVVEHDEQTIQIADHVIDLGPGAGSFGGEIVASGTPKALQRNPKSLTGRYLSGKLGIETPSHRRSGDGGEIVVRGATENNLANVDIAFPTGCLNVVTGVSGSGKSTLVIEILAKAASQHFSGARKRPGAHSKVEGWENIDAVSVIDQSPLGRSPSSNPATYTQIFAHVRDLFSKVPDAKARGFSKGRFSFNMAGGRCEHCEGKGSLLVEMHFLSDVWVECEVCKGQRYNRETLAVRYGGKTVADVLDMEISEAVHFFRDHPKVSPMVTTLDDVGLGYLALGQPATTLSGGEAQRIKLAAELGKPPRGRTLYILDEPTTGLHMSDVDRLVPVIARLVDRGDTVVIIEHDLDVVRSADHVIDLGPEGGDGGGTIVVVGTPEEVADHPSSHTGRFLKERLSVPAGA